MSKKKRKKNKKKRLMRLRELQALGQSDKKEESFSPKGAGSEKEETHIEEQLSKEEAPSEIKEPENKVFKKDLRRVGIVILVCLVILVGLMFIFQRTNLSSAFNFLLLR